MKVCAEANCPELTTTTRCPGHTKAKDKARGTRQERGYDRAYDLHREREARKVASGKATCWQCHLRISPLEPWDDGHCDNDRATIHGAQHRACNRDVTSLGDCAHVSHETHNATPHPLGTDPQSAHPQDSG